MKLISSCGEGDCASGVKTFIVCFLRITDSAEGSNVMFYYKDKLFS